MFLTDGYAFIRLVGVFIPLKNGGILFLLWLSVRLSKKYSQNRVCTPSAIMINSWCHKLSIFGWQLGRYMFFFFFSFCFVIKALVYFIFSISFLSQKKNPSQISQLLLASLGGSVGCAGVVGWCEGAVYLTSLGRPTDIGLQLGKACYPCSG